MSPSERDAAVIVDIAAGLLTYTEIGAKHGLTRARVGQIGKAYGTTRDGLPVPNRPRLPRRWCQTCHRRIDEEHVGHQQPGKLEAHVAEIVALYRMGYGYRAISIAFGTSQTAIKHRITTANVPRRTVGQYDRHRAPIETAIASLRAEPTTHVAASPDRLTSAGQQYRGVE